MMENQVSYVLTETMGGQRTEEEMDRGLSEAERIKMTLQEVNTLFYNNNKSMNTVSMS